MPFTLQRMLAIATHTPYQDAAAAGEAAAQHILCWACSDNNVLMSTMIYSLSTKKPIMGINARHPDEDSEAAILQHTC